MPLAFRLGPMPTLEGPTSLYVAIQADSEPTLAEAADDISGLRELMAAHAPETLTVEPALAKAGKRLGLRRRRLPPELAHAKATMALAIATGGMLESDGDPSLLADLLDASIAFMRAKPWRWVDGDVPLRVEVDGDDEHRTIAGSVMGQAGQEFGLMLCMNPDDLERLLMANSDEEANEIAETIDMLSASMEREPQWAATTIKETLGTRVVPMPMRMIDQQPRPASAFEIAMLSAVLRAASEIDRKSTVVRGRSGAGPSVQVEIHLPEPLEVQPIAPPPKKIGRNAPCPCGSGRKYKRCCLKKDHAASRTPPSRSTDSSSLEPTLAMQILDFADDRHPGWRDDLADAWHVLEGLPYGIQLFIPLLAFQRHVAPGLTARESFINRRGHELDPMARQLLAAQADAVLSVWEVLDVEPGVGLELLDLLTGERRTVHDVKGSQGLSFRQAILARVLPLGSRSVLSGVHPAPLPPQAAHEVVTAIRTRVKLKVKPVPRERLTAPEVVDDLLTQWHAAHARLEAVTLVEREVHNTDGEPFAVHEDRFAIERGRWRDVVAAVLELPDTHLDEDTRKRVEITFVQPGNAMHPHWTCTVIGTATITARELTLEANSRARIDRLRERLEEALGSRIVHRTRKASPPRTIETRADDEGPLAMDATRAGTLWAAPQHWMLREQARHYIDTPVPALDDCTPRQAMGTARRRRALHQLLKESEYHAGLARTGTEDFAAYVREELGLSRTGEVISRTAKERSLGNGRKVSETLLDFAAPVLLQLDDDAELRTVLELAASIWNLSMLQFGSIDPVAMAAVLDDRFARLSAELQAQLETLPKRRTQYFGEDQRELEVRDVRWEDGNIYVEAAAFMRRSPLVSSPKKGKTAPKKTKSTKSTKSTKASKVRGSEEDEGPQQLDLLD